MRGLQRTVLNTRTRTFEPKTSSGEMVIRLFCTQNLPSNSPSSFRHHELTLFKLEREGQLPQQGQGYLDRQRPNNIRVEMAFLDGIGLSVYTSRSTELGEWSSIADPAG